MGTFESKIYELQSEIKGMPENEETLEFLIGVAQEAWSSIGVNILEKFAVTMAHRVQEVIGNGGWYTRF